MFSPTSRGALLCSGPFVVQIRFTDSAAQLTVDLCFPVSRSWCEITVRRYRSGHVSQPLQAGGSAGVAADPRLVGLLLHGPSLNVVPPTAKTPTLCDFGGGTTVYAALAGDSAQARLVAEGCGAWRVEQRAHAGEQSEAWTVLQRSPGLGETAWSGVTTAAARAAEGWAHVMDNQCCAPTPYNNVYVASVHT